MPLFHVLRADLHAHRHAAHFPVVELEAGLHILPVVHVHTHARFAQLRRDALHRFHDGGALVCFAEDGHDHHLDRRQTWRQAQALVVPVRHHHRADHARTDAPRGRPNKLEFVVFVRVADVEGFGEVLPQVMAGARLERLAVAHHGLDAEAGKRPFEALLVALAPGDNGDGRLVDREIRIHVQHAHRLGERVFVRGVGGVAFLPQKLHRAQKQARAQLPAHHVRPLVEQQRQIAVGLNPLLERPADDRFRSGAHDQRLFQFLAPADGHDGQFRRKALHVLGFLLDEAFGNEEREIGVFVAGGLKTSVERVFDRFPQFVTVGLDDHAAAHRRIVRQVGFLHHVRIPTRKVFGLRGDALMCHDNSSFAKSVLIGCPCGAGRAAPQYAFLLRPKIVCKIVRKMILMSSHKDQFSTYHKSYLVRSKMDVSPRSPLTCAQPVMPAFSR